VGLRQHLVRSNGRILFHFTADMWPTITPRYEEDGWWHASRDEVTYYECSACEDRRLEGQSKQAARSDADHQACLACATGRARDAKRRARATSKARASARRAEGRPTRKSQRRVDYAVLGSSDDEIGEPQRATQVIRLLFTAADPWNLGKDTAEAGSVILNMDEVQKILREEEESACQSRTVWLTTSKMGWPFMQRRMKS
jgi:hypothetical protein